MDMKGIEHHSTSVATKASVAAPSGSCSEKRSWDESFKLLKAFKKKNGHCNVPKDFKADPQLGKWVSNQRSKHHGSRLPQHRIDALDEIGFQWELKDSWWNHRLEELIDYRRRKGDCNVPCDWKENPSLGRWVAKQRQLYNSKNDNYCPERKKRLDKLGFDWTLPLPKRSPKMSGGGDDGYDLEQSDTPEKSDSKRATKGDDDNMPDAVPSKVGALNGIGAAAPRKKGKHEADEAVGDDDVIAIDDDGDEDDNSSVATGPQPMPAPWKNTKTSGVAKCDAKRSPGALGSVDKATISSSLNMFGQSKTTARVSEKLDQPISRKRSAHVDAAGKDTIDDDNDRKLPAKRTKVIDSALKSTTTVAGSNAKRNLNFKPERVASGGELPTEGVDIVRSGSETFAPGTEPAVDEHFAGNPLGLEEKKRQVVSALIKKLQAGENCGQVGALLHNLFNKSADGYETMQVALGKPTKTAEKFLQQMTYMYTGQGKQQSKTTQPDDETMKEKKMQVVWALVALLESGEDCGRPEQASLLLHGLFLTSSPNYEATQGVLNEEDWTLDEHMALWKAGVKGG